jgi:hypothetical protein
MPNGIQQTETRRPRQFGLRSLFVLTAAIAAVFGAVHWFGPIITAIGVVMALAALIGYRVPGSEFDKACAAIMAAVACGGILALVAPAIRPMRSPSSLSQCNNNLKMIGLGLQTYADVYGRFPPVYIADENGRPMHSWRVLILPFLEQNTLYREYNFDEPWDGPHNRQLAKQMPPFYKCPHDRASGPTKTSYLAVTGAETVWPDSDSIALSQITDGTSNTLAVVEEIGSGVDWMEPRDLPLKMFGNTNPPAGARLPGAHPTTSEPAGSMVLFCDGHTNFLQNSVPAATLKALATRAGGETIVGDY